MPRYSNALLLALCPAAAAQVVNGDFETGSFPPWSVATTPSGVSGLTSVVTRDIDGPGPLPTSSAARFMVGRSFPGTTAEGVVISQSVPLSGNADYNMSFNWSVWAQVNVYSASGGTFELLVDNATIAQVAAPTTVQGQTVYGQVSASFHAHQTRDYVLAVRITRTTTFGEEVFQYLDNIAAAPACPANCDNSSAPPILNANDFQCFLNAFAAANPYANCDQSTAPPVLNANDFQCFLNLFAAGCS